MPINFKNGFSAAVAKNQKVWEHDRSLTVGASEVFGCIRECYFKKREPDKAEDPEEADPEWGHTERGNLIENEFAVPCLHDMFGESNCFYMGSEQKTFVDGRLSATPDGVVVDLQPDALIDYNIEDIGGGGVIGTEIKTFGGEFAAPKQYKAPSLADPTKEAIYYKAKVKHEGQAQVQMGLLRRKTNYQPDHVAVLYINPANLKDIRPAVVKYDDRVYDLAKRRAESVFDPTKTAKDFPAEGKLRNDCQYCQFTAICNETDMSRFSGQVRKLSEFPAETQEAVRKQVITVAALRSEFKSLESEKKEAEMALRETLLDLGTTRLADDGWSTSLSKNGGRKRTDTARIVEDTGIDLDDYQTEGQPYFVLRTKADDELINVQQHESKPWTPSV